MRERTIFIIISRSLSAAGIDKKTWACGPYTVRYYREHIGIFINDDVLLGNDYSVPYNGFYNSVRVGEHTLLFKGSPEVPTCNTYGERS